MRIAALSMIFVFLASPTYADIQVRFDEGAPKDRFTITNTGSCALGPTAVTIDLSGSPYGLIFDVTGRGAGVEVYQPFELASGGDRLKTNPQVSDGDNRLTLDLVGLAAGESVSFTIDVDDTANSREITVSDQEIVGAKVVAQSASGRSEAFFQNDAVATVELSGCTS